MSIRLNILLEAVLNRIVGSDQLSKNSHLLQKTRWSNLFFLNKLKLQWKIFINLYFKSLFKLVNIFYWATKDFCIPWNTSWNKDCKIFTIWFFIKYCICSYNFNKKTQDSQICNKLNDFNNIKLVFQYSIYN